MYSNLLQSPIILIVHCTLEVFLQTNCKVDDQPFYSSPTLHVLSSDFKLLYPTTLFLSKYFALDSSTDDALV